MLDAAWVCSRSGLLALALNGQKGIFLYSVPINSAGAVPLASSSSVASSQVPLLILSTTSIVRSVSSLGTDLRTYLNSRDHVGGPIGEAPWLLDSLLVTTMSSPSGVAGSSRLSVTSRPAIPTSSLWQLQCMRVRERIPLAFSSNISGFLAVALTGRRGVGYEERVAFRASCSQESELTQCIQRRAQLGYSLDASENLEILADELNQVFALERQQIQGAVECSADFLHESERLISAHRVWVWVNRVESDSKHNISFRKCGALDILRQGESSNRTSVLGKQVSGLTISVCRSMLFHLMVDIYRCIYPKKGRNVEYFADGCLNQLLTWRRKNLSCPLSRITRSRTALRGLQPSLYGAAACT